MTIYAHTHVCIHDGDCKLYYEFIIDSILICNYEFDYFVRLLFGEFVIDKPTIRSFEVSYYFTRNDIFVNLNKEDVDMLGIHIPTLYSL